MSTTAPRTPALPLVRRPRVARRDRAGDVRTRPVDRTLVGSAQDVLSAPRPPVVPVRPGARRQIIAVLDPVWADPSTRSRADEDAVVPAVPDVSASVRAPADVVGEAAVLLTRHLRSGEVVSGTDDGRLLLRLDHADDAARPVCLQEMAYHAIEAFDALGFRVGVIDLGVGWAPITRRRDAAAAEQQASDAARESVRQRDLQPRSALEAGRRPRVSLLSTGRQVLLASVGAMVAVFAGLVGLHHLGIDVSTPLYLALVAALVVTAGSIWAECTSALDPPPLPDAPDRPAPRATAVIAAYLPNEADTIVETLEVFLAQRYSGGLQVVLAYNTPTPLPVEDELRALAAAHRDLVLVRVEDSTSKAQNVNAALRVAEGEFVGIFDADHHPAQGSFERAWRWIADGADVVQGHCVVRNGGDSALAKLVAVEFEQIYAVSHPGRASLHRFGIFGGSNGYWRASALERIRLRGSFLTEDIEASMRVVAAGGRIVNDPGLISRELAPTTPSALWKQRMRWAQGWFQVSRRHLGPALRSPALDLRQKVGVLYLLGWRELYPWIALSAWPLLAFLAWRDGGLDMTSPTFALVTAFVTVSGPLQTLAAWRLAVPEIRQHPRWFLGAALANLLLYTEAKNLVNRVAQLKQLRGEHQWVVTPRTAPSTGSSTVGDPARTQDLDDGPVAA